MRCWLALLLLPALATAQAPAPEAVATMRTLVVTGQQPGPGLWKVKKDGHVMWVFGTLSPLPKRMEWTSAQVERAIAQSAEVLKMPTVNVTVKGAMLGGIFLIPSLLKARNNPGKETLQDVLPADVYARWTVLKKKYLGRDRGVEKRRPLMAAQKLDQEAMDDSGLTYSTKVMDVVERAAKKHKVPMTQPKIDMQIENAKALVKELSRTSLDDVACFDKTLRRLEQEIETTRLRANAWALGEVDILRTLPFTDHRRACADAMLETTIARRAGFTDMEGRIEKLWLDAAQAALQKHERSFAVLPMSLILKEDGWLAKLAARGYTVEAPEPRQ
jgi:uncharacterized protein YbaP (TraB family)